MRTQRRAEGTGMGRARRRRHRHTRALLVASVASIAGVGALGAGSLAAPPVGAAGSSSAAATDTPQVLLVGTFDHITGQYTTIQSAVDAAKPNDWILIAPGDYHEDDDVQNPPSAKQASEGDMAGVLVTTPRLHLRGMSRSGVVVDGTKAGAPGECNSANRWQDFGVKGSGATGYVQRGGRSAATTSGAYGRDGIVIWKANGVSVENLTVCNFLGGDGASGNEVWWNGGDGSGKVGLKRYTGEYLTATSSFFHGEHSAAQYGIFSSNSSTGHWDQLYANNFNDSGMYVGACLQVCDMLIDHAWMENDALGYSGTNSGGRLEIEHSQFDHNEDGLDTNTQIDGDPPAPQDGHCPNDGTSSVTHTHSCWVFINNYVHDNNNDSTPKAGSAAAGPTGTGMTVSGGRWDTVEHNLFENNGAWGILFVPYPDSGTPSLHQSCSKTGGTEVKGFGCVYDPEGDALVRNTFKNDGYFGNPSNSDFGQLTLEGKQPQNCYVANHAPDGSAPSDLEATQKKCGPLTKGANDPEPLLGQVLCDTGFGSCPKGAKYPVSHTVILTKVPTSKLPSMKNPCAGVPANAWCPGGSPAGSSRPDAPSPGTSARASDTGNAVWRRLTQA